MYVNNENKKYESFNFWLYKEIYILQYASDKL